MIFTETTFSNCLSKLDNINAILFFQQNFGLSVEMSEKIKQNFSYDEIVVIDYQDKEKIFPSILRDNLFEIFFSSKKIIKVYNFKPNARSKLKDELCFLNDKKIQDKIVLFFAPELDGKSSFKTFFEKGNFTASIACYLDDEKKASQCINDFFSKKNINIEKQAVDLMAKMLHGDRKLLISECEKLELYVNNKEITINDVNDMIIDGRTADPINFIDNVLAGDIKKALFEFELLKKENTSIVPIIRLFIRSVEVVLELKKMIQEGMNIDEAIKTKAIFWKRVPLIKASIKNTTIKELERYIAYLVFIEKEAKICSESIAMQYFVRYIILSKIRH